MKARKVALLLAAGLTYISHARRMQTVRTKIRERVSSHVKELAVFLLVFNNPAAGWQVAAHGRDYAAKRPSSKAAETRALLNDVFRRCVSDACSRGSVNMQEFDAALFKKHAVPSSFEGTDLTVTLYPSPVLRKRAEGIKDFDDKLKKLTDEMFAVMYGCGGVGVAAPQVGLKLDVFVYNPVAEEPSLPKAFRDMQEKVCCNPKIVEYSEAWDVQQEGCLSSASYCCQADVRRSSEVKVEHQDVKGELQKETLDGFAARVFQHEYDHLQGVLHFDRARTEERKKMQPYLDKLIEEHGPDGALEIAPEVRTNLKPLPLDMDMPLNREARKAEEKRKAKEKKAAASAASKGAGGFSGMGGGGAGKKASKSKKKKR
mmetsp:Transcript_126821/g.224688  ORF Transcript_126821/g.224688 Transcript_126821/m.224688 type:complete len:373 (+) Transcript_126821:84-1202(+)